MENASRRAFDQFRARAQVLSHPRAVDDPARRQRAGAGRNGLTDAYRPLRHGLTLDLIATCPLQRAGDAGAHPELVVRRIRDRVYLECRDVALDHLDLDQRRSFPMMRNGRPEPKSMFGTITCQPRLS